MNQILFSGEIEDISLDKKKNIEQVKKEINTIINQANVKISNVDKKDITHSKKVRNDNLPTHDKLREIEEEINAREEKKLIEEPIKETEIIVDKKEIKRRVAELNEQIQIVEYLSKQDIKEKNDLIEDNSTKKTATKMELINSEINTIKKETETNSKENKTIPTKEIIFESNIDTINNELKNIDISVPLDELVKEKIRQEEIKKKRKNTIYAKMLLQREKKRNYNIQLEL